MTTTPTLREIVAAVAQALPGGPWTVKQPHEGDHYFALARHDGLTLGVFGTTGKHGRTGTAPDRLEVRLNVPLRRGGYASLRDWGLGTYADPVRHPEATMRADKGPEALAREIARRVLTPAEPIHAQIVERMAADDGAANALARAVEALKASAPGLDVQLASDRSTASFLFYSSPDGFCLSGRLSGAGTAYLDHVSSFPADRLPAVLRAARGEG
jgi:hypothetical protein